MNPLIECVGYTPSAEELKKVEAFIRSQPEGDILKVQLFSNFDATSEENLPSGMNVLFRPEAKVDASILSDNLFQTLAVAKILTPEALKDEHFSSAAMMEAVCQFPEDPISGKVHNRQTNQEIRAWSPELGGPGSFAGVYSMLRDDHRTKDYFIAARGTAPLYVQDVKKNIASKGADGPTYAQLLGEAEWCNFLGAAQEAARRNVCRTMLNVAEACGVEIMRSDDVFNGAPYQNLELAYPELSVPEWIQPTHSIRAVRGKVPAVALSYGVVPMEDCLRLEDNHFFVVANPYDGISVFDLSRHEDMMHHSALPADTGRAVLPESVSTAIQDYANRKQGMVWEESSGTLVGAEYHVDLHPSAFRSVDKNFKQAMRKMGWNPEDHVRRMVCVAAKIYNPEMRRT